MFINFQSSSPGTEKKNGDGPAAAVVKPGTDLAPEDTVNFTITFSVKLVPILRGFTCQRKFFMERNFEHRGTSPKKLPETAGAGKQFDTHGESYFT